MQPRVFISHSSKDKAFVETLVDYLQQRGVKSWLDSQQLAAGDSIVQGIEDGLADSDYVLLVVSKNSVESKWVRAEYSAALYNEIEGKGTRIIPLRLDKTPPPIFLADRVYIDFSDDFFDGLEKLVSRLKIEDDEVRLSIRLGQDLGLRRGSIEVHCEASFADCVSTLKDFSLGDIENLLFHRLSLDDLRRVYFHMFEGSLEDLGTGRSKAFLTTEMMVAVARDDLKTDLIKKLCKEYSSKLCR